MVVRALKLNQAAVRTGLGGTKVVMEGCICSVPYLQKVIFVPLFSFPVSRTVGVGDSNYANVVLVCKIGQDEESVKKFVTYALGDTTDSVENYHVPLIAEREINLVFSCQLAKYPQKKIDKNADEFFRCCLEETRDNLKEKYGVETTSGHVEIVVREQTDDSKPRNGSPFIQIIKLFENDLAN